MEVQSPQPDLLTGAVSLEVPIYTVSVDNFSMPLSLIYHTNGIKVFDDPCPVGYGWSLMPALRITRTVLGRPDEKYPFSGDPMSYSDPTATCFMCVASPQTFPQNFKDRYDSEHDLFNISLPDKTLARVLDARNGEMKFIGANDSEYKVDADNNLDEIVVTDPYGNKYFFGEKYEMSYTGDNATVRSSWPLYKIELDNGRIISFQWSLKKHPISTRSWIGGFSFRDNWDMYQWANSEITWDTFVNDNASQAVLSRAGDTDFFLTLESITFPDGLITYTYDESGILGPTLTKIDVTREDERIFSYQFKYADASKTLLTKIDGGEGNTYTFEYNTKYGTSPMTANIYSQDWWGYFNNKDNKTLSPNIKLKRYYFSNTSSYEYREIEGADKSVDVDAMQALMLEKIIWPTGGMSTFEYEAHEFTPTKLDVGGEIDPSFDNILSCGGGLRIKKITTKTDAGDIGTSVRYEYPLARVRAVPSLATFVEVYNVVMGLPDVNRYSSDGVAYMRMVNIMPFSDYMRYDIGVIPLWYEKVTEIKAEGKTESFFADIIPDTYSPTVSYGLRIPNHMNHFFDGSPVMTKTIIYEADNGVYKPVETTEYGYDVRLNNTSISNYHIRRNLVCVDPETVSCPDLEDGRYLYNIPATGADATIEGAYSWYNYAINGYSKTLISKTHTVHTQTGDVTTTENYTYKSGTGLISSVSTTTSEGKNKKVAIEYADNRNGGVEADMVASNIVGIPLRETITNGSATTRIEAEYTQTELGAFRQRTSRVTFGESNVTLQNPVCEYTLRGQLMKVTDADGISTEWMWDAKELYPILKSTGDILTRFAYKPLVGLSTVTQPFGAVTRYEYDEMNRLKSTEIEGLGKIQDITYNFVKDNNYISVSTVLDATRTHTETEHYDNLGRKTLSRDNNTGLSQYFKYDAMGRCYGVSVPSTEAPTRDYDYITTYYEPSPRGMVTGILKNGEKWHSDNRQARVRVLANEAQGRLSCPLYEINGNGKAVYQGHYAKGQLVIEETTDENGHVSRTYTTKTGLVVMTEEGDGMDDMLRTRNIYDDYGRLRFILTPSFQDGTFAVTDDSFIKNCYDFDYDDLGRLVSSRTPGATASHRSVYSAGGRTVAEQTPSMSASNWMVYFYDRHGRPVYSVMGSLMDTEVSWIRDDFSIAEFTGAPTYGGYRLTPEPRIALETPTAAIYYDDYRFMNMSDASYLPKITGTASGLQTGAYDAFAGYSAIEYDAWGRPVTTYQKTAKGVLSTSMTLDRSGAPLAVNKTLSVNGGKTYAVNDSFVYDSAGRITTWQTRMGDAIAGAALSYGKLGLVDNETYRSGARRRYGYDCHGWVETVTTTLPANIIASATSTPSHAGVSEEYYRGVFMTSETEASDLAAFGEYTETILYDQGKYPRYDGTASAHLSTLGGRYDYFFDSHDRLVRADYSRIGLSTVSSEDFSTQYSYNESGAPLTVKRHGVIDRIGTQLVSRETYGVLDELSYSWDGMMLSEVTAQGNGTDYYGRTGYPLSAVGGTASYGWNAAGQLYSDTARGITKITYTWHGLPQFVYFEDGGYLNYTYTTSGQLKSVSTYAILTGTRATKVSERTYCGDFVFEGDSLLYANFAGGYFGGEGQPHYRFTDFQGNVTMVTDGKGALEQHNGYYPYGEPWREPSGQPYLYGGKERMRDNGLNEYDFSARRLNSALCLWTTPDPLAEQFANTNPLAYCAANPIKFIDPSGLRPTDLEGAILAEHVYEGVEGDILQGGWKMESVFTYDESDSFRAGLYSRLTEAGETEFVIAFAGTYFELTTARSLSSIWQDATQFFGVSNDMDLAINTVSQLKQKYDTSEITLVGHSKGGTEAVGAGISNGIDVITYNPAKINLENIKQQNNSNVTNFIVEGEVVSCTSLSVSINNHNINVNYVGEINYLKAPNLDMFQKHKIKTVIDILRK